MIYVTTKVMEGTSRNYFADQSRNWTALPGSCIEPASRVGPWELETVLSKGLQSSCLCGVPGISFWVSPLPGPSTLPLRVCSQQPPTTITHPHKLGTDVPSLLSEVEQSSSLCQPTAHSSPVPGSQPWPQPAPGLLSSVWYQHSLPKQLYYSNPTSTPQAGVALCSQGTKSTVWLP